MMGNMEILMILLLVLAFAGAGVVIIFLGLNMLHKPAVTPENKEEVAHGLFEYFMKADGARIVDGEMDISYD